MAEELTMEQKNYMSSLAGITPQYSVGQLRKIKNAFLQGMSIEEVNKYFSPDVEEEKMEQLTEQFLVKSGRTENAAAMASEADVENVKKAEEKTKDSKKEIEETEAYMEMPFPAAKEETPNRNARAEPEQKKQIVDSGAGMIDKETEDIEAVLAMAKDALKQLNEVKVKYQAMDEFIHSHLLEEKDRTITMLREENKKLKEDLKNAIAIRAAPFQYPPAKGIPFHTTEVSVENSRKMVLPKKAAPITEMLKFWKKNKKGRAQDYIIKLFSNPKFTAEQIAEIRLGLEADLDEAQIKSYAKQEISARQMKEIRMLYELQNRKQQEGGSKDDSTDSE